MFSLRAIRKIIEFCFFICIMHISQIVNFYPLLFAAINKILRSNWSTLQKCSQSSKCKNCRLYIDDHAFIPNTLFGTSYHKILCKQCYLIPTIHILAIRGINIRNKGFCPVETILLYFDCCSRCRKYSFVSRISAGDGYVFRCFQCVIIGNN